MSVAGSAWNGLWINRGSAAWAAGRPVAPWLFAALAIVLGAKLLLVAYLGNVTPYWDQWDAEAARLLLPYMRGTLGLADLMAAHNEHRILFTRLLTLLLVETAGGWNPVVEMAANAVVHLAAIALFLWLLRGSIDAGNVRPLAMLLVLLFAIPFGYENTLAGFQSQFYFLAGMAALCLVLLTEASAFSARWLAGAVLAVAALGTMASAALTPLVGAAVAVVQIAVGARARSTREAAGVAVLLATGIALLQAVPHVPRHDELHATGVADFLRAFYQAAGWPVRLPVIGMLLVQAPLLALGWSHLRRRSARGEPGWRVLALGAWIAAQLVSIAYSRVDWPVSSRYLDLIAFGIVLDLVALHHLRAIPGQPAWMTPARLTTITIGWVATVVAFLVAGAGIWTIKQLDQEVALRRIQERTLTRFVATGEPAALRQPFLHSPYPDASRLAAIASQPEIRGLLAPSFGATPQDRAAARSRLALRGGLALDPALVALLARVAGGGLMALGVGLWLVVSMRAERVPPPAGLRIGAPPS